MTNLTPDDLKAIRAWADEAVWVLFFEDPDRRPEFFSGLGAKHCASERYNQASMTWACHLFTTDRCADVDALCTALELAWNERDEARNSSAVSLRAANDTIFRMKLMQEERDEARREVERLRGPKLSDAEIENNARKNAEEHRRKFASGGYP